MNMRKDFIGALRLLILSVVLPGALHAQVLEGRVRDVLAGMPIPGAIVLTYERDGGQLSRQLTDATGTFRVSSTKVARLRVQKIGFTPLDVALPQPGQPLEITMSRVAIDLAAIHVADRPTCPRHARSRVALELWEQARSGFLAAIVARETNPADASMTLFERRVDPRDDRIIEERRRTRRGRATRPFVSGRPPASLREMGYMTERDGIHTYDAPDADVLLDDSFAASHCFQLRNRSPKDTQVVGLAFSPSQTQRGVVDVEGIVWLRRDSLAIESVTFSYAGKRAPAAATAGGWIDFHHARNGVPIITRWIIRLPVMGWRTDTSNAVGMRNSTFSSVQTTRRVTEVVEIRETGGVVGVARWPDGSTYTSPKRELIGRVVRSDDGGHRGMAGIHVGIVGTEVSVLSDSTGRFTIPLVWDGRYMVRARDPALPSYFTGQSVNRLVTLPLDTLAVLEFPSPRAQLSALCNDTRTPVNTGVLIGRAASENGQALAGVALDVTWLASVDLAGGSARIGREATVLDTSGDFHVCGVARERPIRILAHRGTTVVADTTVRVERDEAAHVTISLDSERRVPLHRAVQGVVREGRGGSPVTGATVTLPEHRRGDITDVDGRFHFDQVPVGDQLLVVRRLGFAARDTVIAVDADSGHVNVIVLNPAAQVIDSVVTTANRVSASPVMREIERRRRHGVGHLIDDRTLRKADGRRLAEVIVQSLPGIVPVQSASGIFLASTRMRTGSSGRALDRPGAMDRCWVAVYIDGALLASDRPGGPPIDFGSLQVSEFSAVEFYPSGATMPAELSVAASACGTLLLWSRS